jgi:hypothetical protein
MINDYTTDLLHRLDRQNDYLDNMSDLSESTEGSKDQIEEGIHFNKGKDFARAKTSCSDISLQTDKRPVAFPFGCQVNFSNTAEEKIKHLQQLLSKQEEDFEGKLQEARKMEDVEDAFQAFLDQLDLNENEERIIIDGESRVWKIIRCSKSIIEDECLEEEEEEDEEEKQTANTSNQSNRNNINEELKEQLINRDRPANPMRTLESQNNEDVAAPPEVKQGSQKNNESDNKEGILILEENLQDSDSNEEDQLKEELEGSIGDPKSGRNSKEPNEEIKAPSPEIENVEKSIEEINAPKTSPNQRDFDLEEDKKSDEDSQISSKAEPSNKSSHESIKFEKQTNAHSEHDKDNDLEILHKPISSVASDEQVEGLKAEDLIDEGPNSSAKKNEGALKFIKFAPEETKQIEPFQFSDDSKDSSKSLCEKNNSEVHSIIENLEEHFHTDINNISRSKSEDWGGAGFKDYYGSDDAIQPMKLHYTEGDLSNIELVEEDSEGEESENSQESGQSGELGEFSDRIQVAQ